MKTKPSKHLFTTAGFLVVSSFCGINSVEAQTYYESDNYYREDRRYDDRYDDDRNYNSNYNSNFDDRYSNDSRYDNSRTRRELDLERDRIAREKIRLERDKLATEKARLQSERARLSNDAHSHDHPAVVVDNNAARAVERCPSGYTPSENKCTQQERKKGCKDIRQPGGLGCVHNKFR